MSKAVIKIPNIGNNIGLYIAWVMGRTLNVSYKIDGKWESTYGMSACNAMKEVWENKKKVIIVEEDENVLYRKALADGRRLDVQFDNIWRELDSDNTGFFAGDDEDFEEAVCPEMLFRTDYKYRIHNMTIADLIEELEFVVNREDWTVAEASLYAARLIQRQIEPEDNIKVLPVCSYGSLEFGFNLNNHPAMPGISFRISVDEKKVDSGVYQNTKPKTFCLEGGMKKYENLTILEMLEDSSARK